MPSIRYQFVASGQREVAAAFRSIGEAARQAEAAQVRGAHGGEAAYMRSAARGANATARAEAQRRSSAQQSAAVFERTYAKEEAAAKKAADAEIRAAEKAGRGVVAAKEKAAASMKRIAERRDMEAHKARTKDENEHRRHEARQTAIATRESAQRAKAYQRAEKAGMADSRSRMGRLGSVAKDATLGAAASVGAAGMAVIGSAARDSMRLQESANRLSINSRGAGEEFVDATTLRKEFEAVAISTPGIKSADVGAALQSYVAKTGDLKGARGGAKTFATMASAAGADIGDVANSAAAMQKLGIKDPEEMKAALASWYGQGKSGAIELKDLAGLSDRLTAKGAGIGLKGVEGANVIGGLAQISRSSTGSSSQAITATEAMLRQLVAKGGDIEKGYGVDVFSDKSKTALKDPREALKSVMKATKGSMPELQKIFGDEGMAGVTGMMTAYNSAAQGLGPKATDKEREAAGAAAMDAMFRKAIDAGATWADVTKDAAQAGSNSSAKMSAVWETVVAKVGADLVPKLEDLATKFMDLDGPLDALVGTAAILADGFSALFDVLASIPMLKKMFGSSSDAKQLNKAERELGKIDKDLAKKGLNASPEDIAKRKAAADRVEALRPGGIDAKEELRVKTAEEIKAEKAKLADPNTLGAGGAAAIGLLGGAVGQGLLIGQGQQNDKQNAVDQRQAENVARAGGEKVDTKALNESLATAARAAMGFAAIIAGVAPPGGTIVPTGR